MIFISVKLTLIFNLQGDKGEAGAPGRDVSFTNSHYIMIAVVLSQFVSTLCAVFTPAVFRLFLPVLILRSITLMYYTPAFLLSFLLYTFLFKCVFDITTSLSLTTESKGFSAALCIH